MSYTAYYGITPALDTRNFTRHSASRRHITQQAGETLTLQVSAGLRQLVLPVSIATFPSLRKYK